VDILLKRLFKIEENIVWGNLNETVTFSHFSIHITYNTPNIDVKITNNGKSSEKLTAYNFFLTDENLTQFPLDIENYALISSGETVSFVLIPLEPLSKCCFFNFKFNGSRLVIGL
jgi:hypothetical protein